MQASKINYLNNPTEYSQFENVKKKQKFVPHSEHGI